ncbi:polysaccharide deacetylase family protein [Prosthecobacter sp.]|uniref:polysaccharide deacetylase family protein n=1 Tax=Prosthecobacter sp. TaxID=1965333 RepID=UPI00378413D2
MIYSLVTRLGAQTLDLGGVKVALESYSGPAKVSATNLDKFKLRVQVERMGESQPLSVRVELPNSGRNVWPANDVEVRDEAGDAMLVRRSGIEWEILLVSVADKISAFVLQAVPPAVPLPRSTSDKERVIQDATSGAQVRIANWPQGRTAALSIRFDDSHPTHLRKAIPILREYGFKGTFMVNPGPKEPGSRQNYSFETQHAEWEAVMKQGDMELANHSAHHRGAKGDDDMDREIGGAAEAIWKLTPGKSKLTALNLGGGTLWETTRTLRHYLDKYHQFDASSGSLGMDDSYGGRVEAFRKALETHLQRGLWCRVHYHYIGEGLSSSEAHFRAALDIAKEHQDKLWIAGMADIHKYQTERSSSKLTLVKSDSNSLAFQLDCPTDAALYDQPLTLELSPPESWKSAQILLRDAKGQTINAADSHLRFEVSPHSSSFVIQATP